MLVAKKWAGSRHENRIADVRNVQSVKSMWDLLAEDILLVSYLSVSAPTGREVRKLRKFREHLANPQI